MTSALILAAGKGRRIASILGDAPKCMLQVDGVPLIQRQVDMLRAAGVDEILVATGHNAHLVSVCHAECRPVSDYSHNMVSTWAQSVWGAHDLVVVYGDVLFDIELLRSLLDHPLADVLVVGDLAWAKYYDERSGSRWTEAESFVFDQDKRLVEIGARTTDPRRASAQYTGLLRMSGRGIGGLKELYQQAVDCIGEGDWIRGRSPKAAYMTDLLQVGICAGLDVRACLVSGGWLEFDTPDDLALVRRRLADGTLNEYIKWEPERHA